MKISICHYSYHRTAKKMNWDCTDFAMAVKALGVEGVDFHAYYLGDFKDAPANIMKAINTSGLSLSGMSLSNDFYQRDPEVLKREINATIDWIRVAAQVQAPVSRIFGGNIPSRDDKDALEKGFEMIIDSIGEVVVEAEKLGVMLALENHGGLPCSAEEQIDVINKINSKNLRATVDIGNYRQCGQEAHVGTEIAAPYAEYVHIKDTRKVPDENNPWGWKVEACPVGQGDIDLLTCLKKLKLAGYDGFVALEYEAANEETIAIPQSIKAMKNMMQEMEPVPVK